ncbi:MAG TPA: DUF2946 family protein [Usitatibacter sp.]|nr:DUF2946 family protein [Usitatibacter sp.]
MIRRRILALVAAFVVAFASLWPLVSAARPRAPDVPVFICTQSGGVQHPGAPADAGDDFHCPLCIAAAEGVIPVVPAVHVPPAQHAIAIIDSRVASPDHLFSPRPPPSRAPPAIS